MSEKSDEKWSLADNLPEDAGEVAQIYDDFAPEYVTSVLEWGYEAPQVSAQLLKQYKVPSDAQLLDAGCGTGLTGQVWQGAGYTQLIGIDISADSLIEAKATSAYIAVQQHDLEKRFPFPDNQFDVTLSIGVLTYIRKVQETMAQFIRVTRPGGLIIFTQRNDLYAKRDCANIFADLQAQGVWKQCYMSERRPYLPQHQEYGSEIEIHYFVYQVL